MSGSFVPHGTGIGMSKRTQVVLNQDVRKLGRSGELVEVAPGYARNYLIPQGLAFWVTPGVLKQIEVRKAEELKRIQQIKDDAEKQKTALQTIGTFRIEKKAGEEDALFGTLTAADVADLLKSIAGVEVDRRNITVPDVRKLGTYNVDVKLHADVTAVVKVEIVPE